MLLFFSAVDLAVTWHERLLKLLYSIYIYDDPMNYTVYGILQARILEGIAIHFSKVSSQLRDQTQVSYIAADSLPAEPPEKPINVFP